MRIGFDIDGVLADFQSVYQQLVVRLTGRDLFHSGDAENPPVWDWPEHRGYLPSEMQKVWVHIVANPHFWQSLPPTPFLLRAYDRLAALGRNRDHDLYFVTDRRGLNVKRQTENWLDRFMDIQQPTVLITPDKGGAARLLKLDAYIDDRWDNVQDVATMTKPRSEQEFIEAFKRTPIPKLDTLEVVYQTPMTRPFLLNKRYNADKPVDPVVTRIDNLEQFLDLIKV